MRRVEIDDRRRQSRLLARAGLHVRHRDLQRTQQPLAQGLSFRKQPNAECRIEILKPREQLFREMLPLQQQRMHLARLRRREHGEDIDLDRLRLQPDFALPDAQALVSRFLEATAQFANDLAQHGARLCFARLAP